MVLEDLTIEEKVDHYNENINFKPSSSPINESMLKSPILNAQTTNFD